MLSTDRTKVGPSASSSEVETRRMDAFYAALASLIVVVGPWKAAIVFAERTAPMPVPTRRMVGIATVIISLAIAIFFVVLGDDIIHFFHISEAAFLVAAGSLVFVFAVRMVILDDDHGEAEEEAEDAKPKPVDPRAPWRLAAYPLSVPLLVTPPAIATLVALSVQASRSDTQSIELITAILVVMAFNLLVFMALSQWAHLIPMEAWSVAGRILGVLLAAFGVGIVIQGIQASGLVS